VRCRWAGRCQHYRVRYSTVEDQYNAAMHNTESHKTALLAGRRAGVHQASALSHLTQGAARHASKSIKIGSVQAWATCPVFQMRQNVSQQHMTSISRTFHRHREAVGVGDSTLAPTVEHLIKPADSNQ
jgi:hypothetical protein